MWEGNSETEITIWSSSNYPWTMTAPWGSTIIYNDDWLTVAEVSEYQPMLDNEYIALADDDAVYCDWIVLFKT